MSRPGIARWLQAALLALLLAACASLPPPPPRQRSAAIEAPQATALGQWVEARRQADGARRDSGFLLLDNADAAYAARLALAAGAQRSLDLQYYAIHADASTAALLDAVREAARRGVRVRILLDDFNTVGRDAQVLRLAFEPNIELRLFNPLPGPRGSLLGRLLLSLRELPRTAKRMHNKLFVADNALGVAGGRNLGDAYFGGDGKSRFVDLDVLAAGRIVRDMSASFDRYWNDELAYPVEALVSREELDALRRDRPTAPDVPGDASQQAGTGAAPIAVPPRAIAPASAKASPPGLLPVLAPGKPVPDLPPAMDIAAQRLTWAPAALLADEPGKIGPDDDEADAGETVVDGLLQLMAGAQRELLIVTPYFVPGRDMLQALAQLRGRGVRIRVLTNSLASNDAIAAHAGYARHREALLRLGIELYEMRAASGSEAAGLAGSAPAGLGSGGGGSKGDASHASLHSKAVVIDERSVVIGSMNLDLRSQRKNSEVALLLRSAALARQASQRIGEVLAQGAYRLQTDGRGLLWKAPPGAGFGDSREEPLAGARLKALAALVAPFAPDEML